MLAVAGGLVLISLVPFINAYGEMSWHNPFDEAVQMRNTSRASMSFESLFTQGLLRWPYLPPLSRSDEARLFPGVMSLLLALWGVRTLLPRRSERGAVSETARVLL